MKILINKLFSKQKRANELLINAPKEINYFSLLNYIFSISKKITPKELYSFLSADEISAEIDKTTIARLRAFHHFFIENWQEAYELALPLATTQPYDQDMVGLIATIWNNSGKFKNALAIIKEYSDESRIDNKEAYLTTRGTTAWCAGETDEALLYLERALELNPECREALSTLAGIYAELGNHMQSILFREKLLSLYHQIVDVSFYEGMYKIGEGKYEEGWALYEKRYESSVAPKYFDSDLLVKTRWDGSYLNGKVLFLYFEQGLGDTLMSCRFVNDLINLGGKIIAECQPEITDILQSNFPEIDFFYRTSNEKIDIKFDFWIGSMSLPHLLKINNDRPPLRDGYLKVPTEFSASEHLFRKKNTPKIGISWSGNPAHTNDARRSIPWETIKQIIGKSELDFYAIQTFIPEGKPDNLIDLSDHLITLSDTAQLISKLDLIITVDTSLVHLAGALGIKTWLLCNKTPEWRWGNDSGATRWYSSVKLLKNEKFNDWTTSLEKMILIDLPLYLKENQQ